MYRSITILVLGFLSSMVDWHSAASSEERARVEAECVEDRENFLALDYWTFDQDPKTGIRSVIDKDGCELVAADLIHDFHQRLRTRGEPVIIDHAQGVITLSEDGEMSILYWHEGQIRAFEGQTKRAIELFRKSVKPEHRNVGAWNAYAQATIAFLENDLDELTRQRTLMADAKRVSPINLGVVDGLIACFGKTYTHAYSSEECNRRPKN